MNKRVFQEHYDAYLLSFLIPVLSMILIFAARGIFPFGEETFLRTDMYHQYAPFFSEFQHKLRSGGSLLYSWDVGMGVNFSALYAYYLASPLNLLILLCPKSLILEFMTYMIVFKIGLSGVTMAFYLRHHFGEERRYRLGVVFFAIFYAMSGYIAAYSWNIMWLDCILLFPLVILGGERLMKGQGAALYTITLGLCIFSNYYISIMICLFLVIWFFMEMIIREEESLRELLSCGLRFALFSLLAGGMAAVMLMPEIFALKGTASGDIDFPTVFKQYFSIVDMLARHLPAVETEQGLDHWPNIYCGTAMFLLIPLYIMNPMIRVREKAVNLTVLVFLLMSFSINVLNFIWHGFHYPNSLPCRQGFIYIFLLLRMGYEAFRKRKYLTMREVNIALGIAVGFVLLAQKEVDDDAIHFMVYYGALALLGLYYLLFCLEKKHLAGYNLLALSLLGLTALESTLNMGITSVTTTSRTAYTKDNLDVEKLVKEIQSEDRDFYRFEKMTRKTKDDGAWMNFPSVSIFSSTAYANLSDFFRLVGCEASTNAYSITGSTPLINMLFGVKYDLFSEEPEAPEEQGLSFINSSGESYLYRTDYALPLGYMMSTKELGNWHLDIGTPALVQDSLSDAMEVNPVLINVLGDFQEEDYCFTTDHSGEYYVYVNNRKIKKAKAVYPFSEKSFDNVDRGYFLELGYLEAGQEIRLRSETSGQSMDCTVYRFDYDALAKLYGKLSQEPWELDRREDTLLSGTVNVQEDGILVTSIPLDMGWKVTVDGQEVKTEGVLNDSFIGVPLTAGTHRVEMKYFPRGLVLGAALSGASLLLFLFLLLGSGRYGHGRRRHHPENPEEWLWEQEPTGAEPEEQSLPEDRRGLQKKEQVLPEINLPEEERKERNLWEAREVLGEEGQDLPEDRTVLQEDKKVALEIMDLEEES